MGTRYDFDLTVNLKEDIPDNVVAVLSYLMIGDCEPPPSTPDHPFFSYDWKKHPFCNWATAVDPHAGDAICSFHRVYRCTRHGIDQHEYTLHLRFAGKLETVMEVGISFAMWLATHSEQDEYVGYFKSEDEPHPTLLYFRSGETYIHEVKDPPLSVNDGRPWDQ